MSIVLVGLMGRTIIDKVLATQGGAEAVALWSQVGSLVDLLSGIGLNGIGVGVAVMVANETQRSTQWATLRAGVGVSLLLSGVLLVLLVSHPQLLLFLAGGLLPTDLLRLASVAGWLGIIPGILNSYWQGKQYRYAMLAWAVVHLSSSVVAIEWSSGQTLMIRLLWAQIALALVVLIGLTRAFILHANSLGDRASWWPLLRFAKVGLAIGLLSPLASLIMRRLLAETLSWREVGMIQAQWRITDWVMALASGVMANYYLPLLSATMANERHRQLRRMALVTLLPSAVVFLGYLLFQEPIIRLFYQHGFALAIPTAAIFLLGDWIRLVSWVFLYAMFVRRQTWAIALGEFLSLPLFATLLWLAPKPLSPFLVSCLWVGSYCAYAAFNAFMVIRKTEGGGLGKDYICASQKSPPACDPVQNHVI